jgi:hypothetical protein
MNLDATFEMVSARQHELKLLAGPQPLIPLFPPPSDTLRQRIRRLVGHLGGLSGAPGARAVSAEPQAPRP